MPNGAESCAMFNVCSYYTQAHRSYCCSPSFHGSLHNDCATQIYNVSQSNRKQGTWNIEWLLYNQLLCIPNNR